MRLSPYPAQEKKWRSVVCQFYKTTLSLYPKNFRSQFSLEMNAVFEEALGEQIQLGWVSILLFLGRELFETPISALNQHFAIKATSIKSYLDIIFAYTLGFILLGLIDLMHATTLQNEIQGYIVNLVIYMTIGGLIGLTVGIITVPRKKTLFSLCGMVCFLTCFVFPDFIGSIFLLVLVLAIRYWRRALRLAVYGTLSLLVGFMANRISAALLQSYLFHSPTQALPQTGPAMVLIPLLITGFSLGILLGGVAPKSSTVKA